MNNYSKLFKEREKVWFDRMKPFIFNTSNSILKIGNGFGYLSEMVRHNNPNTTVLDVATFDETINKPYVELYDGNNIPFPEKRFDISLLNLTLHHIPDSREYLKNEVVRVTKRRIILVEETYDTIFQKIHLVFRDWYLNKKAGQSCDIHWGSYFSRNELSNFIKNNNMNVVHRLTTKHHSYYKELLIIDINQNEIHT